MGCRLPHNYSPALLKHSWLSYQRDAVLTNINLFYLQNGVLILLFSRNRSLSVRDNKTLLIFLFVYIFFVALSSLFPLSHDDWFWASEPLQNRIVNVFYGINGRYAGNLFVLLLTRAGIFRPFIISFIITSIFYLIYKLSGYGRKNIIISSVILFLAMPSSVFVQSVSWISGFANYAASALCVLFFLYICNKYINSDGSKIKKINPAVFFPVGIISQLFMENVTLYLLLISLFIIIYRKKKHQCVPAVLWVYFSAFVVGAIIMFTNPVYISAFDPNQNIYQNVTDLSSGLLPVFSEIINKLTETISKYLIIDNAALNIVLSVLCMLIIRKYKSKAVKSLFIAFYAFFCIYTVFRKINSADTYISNNLLSSADAILAFMFLLAVLLTAVFFIKKPSCKKSLYFYLASICILSAPFLLINPVSPRCFLITYLLFILIINNMLNELANYTTLTVNCRKIACLLFSVLLCFSAFYFYVFSQNFVTEQERKTYIESCVNAGDKEILITKYPYRGYVWLETPYSKYTDEIFKQYYHIPTDTELKVISYDEWKTTKQNIN